MSIPLSAVPKDHYVPQTYLDAFAIEGPGKKNSHIYQYMKDKIVGPRIRDVASEKHFYTVKHKDTGTDIRDLENIFSEIEGRASLPLKRIIENEKIDLEDIDLVDLATFIALLVVRTPGFINSQKSAQEETMKERIAIESLDINKLKKRYEESDIFLTDQELKEQQDLLLEKRYSIDFEGKDYFLAEGLRLANELTQWYYERKYWHLLISDSDRVFVTSDNPVSIYRPIFVPPVMNAGYGNGTLFIPISPRLGILLRDAPHNSPIIKLSGRRVDEFNKNTARFATSYIFSNLKSKKMHEMYKRIESRTFQKMSVTRHRRMPYIFMGGPQVPEEPLLN